jgi:hypothetical protein
MGIRIRVYPQYGSIGIRRGRNRRIQQQLHREQSIILRQQAALHRQQLRAQMAGIAAGIGGYGMGLGYGAGFGTQYGSFGSLGSATSTIWGPGPYQQSYVSQQAFPPAFPPPLAGHAFAGTPYLGAGLLASARPWGC